MFWICLYNLSVQFTNLIKNSEKINLSLLRSFASAKESKMFKLLLLIAAMSISITDYLGPVLPIFADESILGQGLHYDHFNYKKKNGSNTKWVKKKKKLK